MSRWLTIVGAVFFAAVTHAASVSGLRCEARTDPVGIDVERPRLAWQMLSENRGARQSAYEIEVRDTWSSGRIAGDTSIAVRYSGPPLKPGTEYRWRVRVWDEKGQAGAWSDYARFVTGKLQPQDWQGKWIGAPAAGLHDALLGFAVEHRQADATNWVQVDLGTAVRVDRIVLHPMTHDDASAGGRIDGYGFPVRFRIEAGDDAMFTSPRLLADRTSADVPNPGWVATSFNAGAVTARFVRLTVMRSWPRGPGLPHVNTLGELEIFSGGRNVAHGRPVEASASVEGYGWAKAQLTDGRALAPAQSKAAGVVREHPHGALYLRRDFQVAKPVTRALVCFSGLGFSELALDGRKVGDYVIGPGFTTYDKRVPYLAFDVTDRFAQPGAHRLDVTLVDGWYGLARDPWVHRFEQLPYVDRPKLLLDLHLWHADGSETVIGSDEAWRWSEGEITRSWIAEEDVDLRRTNRTWGSAVVVTGPSGRLVSQREPFNRIVEEVRPVAMTYDAAKGTATWDFGREINGWARFRASGTAGTHLAITTVPVMSSDDGVPAPSRRTSRFTLAGTGSAETYEPRFFHAGMRQVVVSGLTSSPATNDLAGCFISSKYTPSGGFRCSDPVQNELYDSVRRTVVAYTTFLPNDPVREWKAWTQDIENMFRSAVYLFDSQAMYERWQHDLLDGQRADGRMPNIAPGPFFDDYNSPWWGGCSVWLPWHWYLYYGDDTLLRESYPAMKRYVDHLDRIAKNGQQDWGLADWLPVEETPRPLINTPAHVLFAQIVSRTADRLGLDAEAAHYAEMAARIRDGFNAAYLDTASGIYGVPGWKVRAGNWKPPVPLERLHTAWWTGDRPCTQAGQALPLALGLVPSAHRSSVEAALLREIAAHSNRVSTGFVSTPYLLELLADLAPEAGWAMTSAREFPSWYAMTAGSGSDVMKETWAGGQALMPSLGGNLAQWHMEALAGLRPDPAGPGFQRFLVKPAFVGDLREVAAWHHSPYGRIECAWKRTDRRVELRVTVPPNTRATVWVPGRTPEEVTEGDQPIARVAGLAVLRTEPRGVVIDVPAGRYRFEGNLP